MPATTSASPVDFSAYTALKISRPKPRLLEVMISQPGKLNAVTEAGHRELANVWRSVQSVLARDVPAAWVYHSRGLQGVSRRVQNVTLDLRGELESLTRWRMPAR